MTLFFLKKKKKNLRLTQKKTDPLFFKLKKKRKISLSSKKQQGRDRPPGRQLLRRLRRAGKVPPHRLPEEHRDQRSGDGAQRLQPAELRVAQLCRPQRVQVSFFSWFFLFSVSKKKREREREKREKKLTCFFFLFLC